MTTKIKLSAIIAWALCAIVVVGAVLAFGRDLANGAAAENGLVGLLHGIITALVPIAFVGIGALIVSQHQRNVIGWLLMLPTLLILADPLTNQLAGMQAPPASPPFLLIVALWFDSASWLLIVFPVLLIFLLFPTGSPPSPRWHWVIYLAVGMFILFWGLVVFGDRVGPSSEEFGWTISNPIGFIPTAIREIFLGAAWLAALLVLTLLCVSSLFVRYRRAGTVERQQIKWLLFACGLFAIIYVPMIILGGNVEALPPWLAGILFLLIIVSIPIAIGIAILRHRVFDIDVIIRRTVTYALVTASLVIVFFGIVIVLQQIFARLTVSGGNELVTVISTLAIAALFVPLRNRIQSWIDRRFNRKKYDVQKVMEQFGQTVRDETDLERLTGELVNVIQETMQPKSVSLWLKREEKSK